MGRLTSATLSLDYFITIAQIGFGGSSNVYKAWHKRLEKHVAIKELRHTAMADIDLMRNEIEALKRIKNLQVPQVFDFQIKGNRSYTILEFIEGESFDKLLVCGGSFSEDQVKKWYKQLALILKAIHNQSVFHRDIKPANIILTPTDDVVLIDFNTALVDGNALQITSRSKGYASPEQDETFQWYKDIHQAQQASKQSCSLSQYLSVCRIENTEMQQYTDNNSTELTDAAFNDHVSSETNKKQPVDWCRADIYSLGATIYHLLTGKRPPKRTPEFSTIGDMGDFSNELKYVIEKSMEYDPTKRYASAEQIIDALNFN